MPKKTKQIIPAEKALETDKDYQNLLDELKSIITKGQFKAYQAVDNIKVQTYWQLGERIVREELKHKERADYGLYLINNLALDLNIPKRNLYRIVKFYRCYEKVASLMPQLSWTHYYQLVDIDDSQKRAFYENQAIINSWSVRELRRQIRTRLYENTPKKEIQAVFQTKLPAVRSQEVFKDTYNFQFIELQGQNEKELEEKILANLITFLRELGEDFCIRGSQIPLKIDQETHHIDLVLYHCGIPCSVLVDLKIGRLAAQDIGQMNKYLGYWRRYKQYAHEQPAIGLIICREAGREEVIYALDGLEEKIFVARYKVKLPSEAKIKKAIKKL